MRWHASLQRAGEIAYVRRAGRRWSGETLATYVVPDPAVGRWRVAVTVSKSVGNAVVRNRVKRRLRGALDALPPPAVGARAVFVARAAAGSGTYEQLAREVGEAIARFRG